jgi:DHA1 family bicyclomycin/chloramphenicol resistance-like MFS transporter
MTEPPMEAARRAGTSGFPEPIAAAPRGITTPILLSLALLASVPAFATDLYLPAFPQMMTVLRTTAAGVQLTLTAFLIGAGLGQLLFGPLSDRYGRVRPVVAGASVCVVASAAAALSPSIAFLIAARFVQGAAASAGMVVGRAIISDLAPDGQQSARAFNLMMIVMGVAPIVAPSLGSALVGPFGWRGTLWAMFAIAVIVLAAVLAFLRESHPPERRARIKAQQAAHGAGLACLATRGFLGNTLAFVLAFAAFMAYISASPFVFQVIVGLTVVQYGILFAVNALILSGVGAVAAHLAKRVSIRRQARFGLLVLLGGSAAVAGVVFLGAPPVWTIPTIVLAIASLGFVIGNLTSAAISAVPRAAGTGSAVLGAVQFMLGAVVAPLVGIRGAHSAIPLAVVMTTASGLAIVAFWMAGEPKPHLAIGDWSLAESD